MMLSTTAQRGMIERHADLSIAAHLTKPINEPELLVALSKQFSPEEEEPAHSEKPLTTATEVSNVISSSVVVPPSPLSLMHILLVEDNLVNQKLALRVLERLGCRTTVASNGLQAVNTAKEIRFDLILMDIQMPVMGGFDATAAIRKTCPHNMDTPIIAMTAHAIQGYREKCLRGGMEGYISKVLFPSF